MNLVILLDLNYTLVANSNAPRQQPFTKQIEKEQYRKELLELLKHHTVVLITARPSKFQQETLMSIQEKTGMALMFDWEIFNDTSLPPHKFKAKQFTERIKPTYPDATFLAIESNPRTIEEYKKLGVLCLTVT